MFGGHRGPLITIDPVPHHPAQMAGVSRLRAASVCAVQLRNLPVEPGEVAFPYRVVWREARQPYHDCPALPQCVERLCLVAHLPERISELGIGHRQVALP
jgi:hypothetical protein